MTQEIKEKTFVKSLIAGGTAGLSVDVAVTSIFTSIFIINVSELKPEVSHRSNIH